MVPVPASYKTHNVSGELATLPPVLQFYRHLLALRHQTTPVVWDYVALNQDNPNVLSYFRVQSDEPMCS